jgi:hypothetical protein
MHLVGTRELKDRLHGTYAWCVRGQHLLLQTEGIRSPLMDIFIEDAARKAAPGAGNGASEGVDRDTGTEPACGAGGLRL